MRLAGWLLIVIGCLWLFAQAHAEPRSVILLTGVVEGSEHEWNDGSGNIGTLTISAPRNSVPLMLLKDLRGETVEVVLRVVEKRELQEVRR